MGKLFVISLGGSLIVPEHIDIDFLKKLKSLVMSEIENGNRFVFITGGGRVAREYQGAAQDIEDLAEEDLDWLGIHATRLNAHLLRTIFREVANPKIVTNPTKEVDFTEEVLVASGWRPGCSTDYDAVILAKNLRAKNVLNLSNISHVYDKDPNKHDDAEPIHEMTWSDFRKLIPEDWKPGLNSPFDPIASREAERLGIEVAIMDGKDLNNLKNYIDGKDFNGTRIKP